MDDPDVLKKFARELIGKVLSGSVSDRDALQAEKMPFTYYGEDLKSGHLWETWRKCILQFLPKLF